MKGRKKNKLIFFNWLIEKNNMQSKDLDINLMLFKISKWQKT